MSKPTPSCRFLLHGHHVVLVYGDRNDPSVEGYATCDTCSLSKTIALAAVFAYQHGILKLTVDGADLKRQ